MRKPKSIKLPDITGHVWSAQGRDSFYLDKPWTIPLRTTEDDVQMRPVLKFNVVRIKRQTRGDRFDLVTTVYDFPRFTFEGVTTKHENVQSVEKEMLRRLALLRLGIKA